EMAEVFHAATVGGAQGLLREDIGRLAVGAKADLVVVDLGDPWMMPVHDPLRSLVFHAADRAVRDVWIGGRPVVSKRRVLTRDRVAAAQVRMEAVVPQRDPRGRASTEITPLSLPILP